MGCCDNMLKYVVFLCNFVFFLTGGLILGMGVYLHLKMEDYYDFMTEKYFSSSIILMVAGGVILIVAFFGCCGACTGRLMNIGEIQNIRIVWMYKTVVCITYMIAMTLFLSFAENACMMYTFGTLIALILIVELGCAVTVFLFKDDAWNAVNEKLTEGLQNYGKNDTNQGVTKAWDMMQVVFKCCGVKEFTDWGRVSVLNKTESVPDSCCLKVTADCGNAQLSNSDPSGDIYTKGCLTKLGEFIKDNAMIVGIVGASVVVLQIIGVIVACCLGRQMRELQNFV